MAFAAFALGACTPKEQPTTLDIDNKLTPEEISAARLTPPVMWKMGRLASASLSPDGTKALYAVTRYNMSENRGLSQIYVRDMASGEEVALTDNTSNNNDPQWSADGSAIYFTSNRSGEMQLWQMGVDGSAPKQITKVEGGIEGYGVAPSGERDCYRTSGSSQKYCKRKSQN